MENILCRFPHLFRQILEELDIKSLADCRLVGKHWLIFVDNEKYTWIRMIRELSEDQGRIQQVNGYISNCDPNNIRYGLHLGMQDKRARPQIKQTDFGNFIHKYLKEDPDQGM
jgi:hypothetical protein